MISYNRIRIAFTCLFFLAFLGSLSANNLQIQQVSLTSQNTTEKHVQISFDVSWENSWRTDNMGGSGSASWDAAWLFVKYRIKGSGQWHHASLHDSGHSAGSGTAAHVAVGLPDQSQGFHATNNPGVGVFLYRSANGTGTFAASGVSLRWNYGVDAVGDDAIAEVRVFGMEMVYVPDGAFYLGSGGTETGSFTDGGWSAGNTIPFVVHGEEPLETGTGAGKLWGTSTTGNSHIGPAGTLGGPFPKGYAGFYSMKYNITQQQYTDFLNSLSFAGQDARANGRPDDASGTYVQPDPRYRHGIRILTPGVDPMLPAVYETEHPNLPNFFMSWADLAHFTAWAGLRPMSELEFEKAARGLGSPTANEYAWGASTHTRATGVVNAGLPNEAASNAGANAALNYIQSGGLAGPVRVGAFATATSSRSQAGASFWGIMGLSDNVLERTISIGRTEGRAFTGLHGRGQLEIPSGWPSENAVGSGLRGSSWYEGVSRARVSDREMAVYTDASRFYLFGGRAVRTAPGARVVTSEISGASATSASSGGSVTTDGTPITARGLVWGTSMNPSLTSNQGVTSEGSGTGSFTSSLSGLSAATTYYVRAYATTAYGTTYGNQRVFTTILSAPVANAGSSASCTGFQANWSASTGATGYRLDVSLSSEFSSFVPGYENLDVGNVLFRSVSGLVAGTVYYYRVRAYSSGGTSENSGVINIATLPPAPSQPGVIAGTTTQCPSISGQIYSINSVPNASSYTWTVPNGWTITAGQESTQITVTTGSTGQNGIISVTADSPCGSSMPSTLAVTVGAGIPARPGTISGLTAHCPNTPNASYSISPVTNASGYTWVVPAGWTITSGEGTAQITVTTGSSGQGGTISVTADNQCGSSASRTLSVSIHSQFLPGAIATTGQTICALSTASTISNQQTATGGSGGVFYQWQQSSNGVDGWINVVGGSSATSSSYQPPSTLTQSTWYRRLARDGSCQTELIPSTGVWKVTVNERPQLATAQNSSRCGTGTLVLGVNNVQEGSTVDWYAAATGGSVLTGGSGTTSYTTPSISSSRSYFAQIRDLSTGCLSTARVEVVATINPIPALAAAENAFRCDPGPLTISVSSVPLGSTIDWYSASSGGSVLSGGQGTLEYTTPSLTATTNYWAQTRDETTGCVSSSRRGVSARILSLANAPNIEIQALYFNRIIYKWNSVSGAVGYLWNTVNELGTATNLGSALTYTEADLEAETSYTRYIWAYNDCGISGPGIITITTPTDPCNGQTTITFMYMGNQVTYGTVAIDDKCWMDRNLGAEPMPFIPSVHASGNTDERLFGDLFQFGRLADGHQYRNSGLTTAQSTEDVPGHSNFITRPWSSDWRNPSNPDLWQGVNSINIPCPPGWRIPTSAENHNERSTWLTNDSEGAFNSTLKWPLAGLRLLNGELSTVGNRGYSWHSNGGVLYYHETFAGNDSYGRASGQSVRCLRNEMITTMQVVDISASSAKTGGSVPYQDGVSMKGVVWGTSPFPTLSNHPDGGYTQQGNGNGTYESIITGLIQGKVYYVRAYAIHLDGTSYGQQIQFALHEKCDDYISFTYLGKTVTYGTVVRHGLCWMDRNLGAISIAGSFNDPKGYGDLFQWGRQSDGHQLRNATTTVTCASDASIVSDLRIRSGFSDWLCTPNDNLWQGESGVNNPCPEGWRVPTSDELNKEVISWHTRPFESTLKWSATGYHSQHVYSTGVYGYVWSSSVNGSQSRGMSIHINGGSLTNTHRANGFSVRCVRTLHIYTDSATEIITHSARLSGGIVDLDNISERGFVWSTDSEPTLTNHPGGDRAIVGSGMGAFFTIASNLSPGTIYYVKTYAIQLTDTIYGNQVMFTTGAEGTCGSDVTFVYNGNEVTYKTHLRAGLCWMDRNLGAEPLPFIPSEHATGNTDVRLFGDLFQWGRLDDGHQLRNSSTTTQRSNTDVPNHSSFIIGSSDWRNPSNDNLWQGNDGVNNPCPPGWRVPSRDEFLSERNTWAGNTADLAYASTLKWPLAGDRNSFDLGRVHNEGVTASIYVSDKSSNFFRITSTSIQSGSSVRSSGFSVRCVQDYIAP